MLEQVFKNIDDILYKDPGADSELDYVAQTSWVLFLRYLDEIEKEKADKAIYSGKEYQKLIDDKYSWNTWALPKDDKGELDHHVALTGNDLVEFVDRELFPYLASFKQKTDNPQTLEYKVGEIFSELNNKIQSGYNLRDIIELADGLPFRTDKDKDELSHLYETKIKNMGNAGRNGGQFYTPRPLIRTMINIINPKIGETLYDPAVGSAGFLCEAFEYISTRMEKTTENQSILQEKTFYGKEKKNLAYVIGIMNMILHGIEAPNITHINTLGENIRDIQEKDRYNIILANPPFGGKERAEVQQNSDIKTGETSYLFLQHFIKSLRTNGRAAIVIKSTFLTESPLSLRQHLFESCNVHSILILPYGVFVGAGVKTIVLFFEKGLKTKKTWVYKLNPNKNFGKTNPLKDEHLADFITKQKTKVISENSWEITMPDIIDNQYVVSDKNPNFKGRRLTMTSKEILKKLTESLKITNNLFKEITDE